MKSKQIFPIENLAKMKVVIVFDNNNEEWQLNFQDLELITINNQLCWKYESQDGRELIMPICRKSTINKLFENKE